MRLCSCSTGPLPALHPPHPPLSHFFAPAPLRTTFWGTGWPLPASVLPHLAPLGASWRSPIPPRAASPLSPLAPPPPPPVTLPLPLPLPPRPPPAPIANIELALGGNGSTSISLGDMSSMDAAAADAAADPHLAASMEAALGALAAQVRDMQERLAATKAAVAGAGAGVRGGAGASAGAGAAGAAAAAAAASAGAGAGAGAGLAGGMHVEGEAAGSDPWALPAAVAAAAMPPPPAPALQPYSAQKARVGPRTARTMARPLVAASRTASNSAEPSAGAGGAGAAQGGAGAGAGGSS